MPFDSFSSAERVFEIKPFICLTIPWKIRNIVETKNKHWIKEFKHIFKTIVKNVKNLEYNLRKNDSI